MTRKIRSDKGLTRKPKTTHIRVDKAKKPYLRELAKKSIEILKNFLSKYGVIERLSAFSKQRSADGKRR